jgi:DNA-binding FadR family transcriptional regulator
LLAQLRDLTVRHQFTLSLVPGRSSVSLPQHEAIVEAVVNKDPVAAEQAMHVHLQSVMDAFSSLAAASMS